MRKRLIKKAQDIEIINIDLKDLILSSNSIYGAFRDCLNNKCSYTNGLVDVWKTEEGYLLVDGFHRMIEYLLKGIININAKVIGQGYTDYWAIPEEDNRFIIDYSLKYNGLEDLADEEVLDDLHEQLINEIR